MPCCARAVDPATTAEPLVTAALHVDPVVALVGAQVAALLFRQRSDNVCYFSRDRELGPEDQAKLDALGIPVIAGGVSMLEIDGDRLTGVRLGDGRVVEVEALAVASRMVARADVFAGIGIEATAHPVGSNIAADPTGRTSVPGVWVAGNSTLCVEAGGWWAVRAAGAGLERRTRAIRP